MYEFSLDSIVQLVYASVSLRGHLDSSVVLLDRMIEILEDSPFHMPSGCVTVSPDHLGVETVTVMSLSGVCRSIRDVIVSRLAALDEAVLRFSSRASVDSPEDDPLA